MTKFPLIRPRRPDTPRDMASKDQSSLSNKPSKVAEAYKRQIFSSPSNGTDDLYGAFDGRTLRISSHHKEQSNIYQINSKNALFLDDTAYQADMLTQGEERCSAIAVVVELGTNTYVVACGSDVWQLSGINIKNWRAEVGNSNVTYLYGTINGTEYTIIPTEYVDVEHKCWGTKCEFMSPNGDIEFFPAKIKWLWHDSAVWNDSILDELD